MAEALRRRFKPFTTEGDAVGGDDAGLDDGVLLAREGLLEQAAALDGLGPEADEEVAEEAGGDVERGDDPRGEVELHDDDAEHDGEQRGDDERPQRELLPPRRHPLVREHPLHRRRVARRGAIAARQPLAAPGLARALARVAVPQLRGRARLRHLLVPPAPASRRGGGARRHLLGRSLALALALLGLVLGAAAFWRDGPGLGDFSGRKRRKKKSKKVRKVNNKRNKVNET